MKMIIDKYIKISCLKDWLEKNFFKCLYQLFSVDERGVLYLREIIYMVMICCIDNR